MARVFKSGHTHNNGGFGMGDKEKRLCDWKEADISDKQEKFVAIVHDPRFFCKKCGRVAQKKKWLHKPVALPESAG